MAYFPVFFCLLQGAVCNLTFHFGFIQVVCCLRQFEKHLFVQIFFFQPGLFQFGFGCPDFVGTFTKMIQGQAHVQQDGKTAVFEEGFVV
jgi:hypothetical protein